MQNVAHAIGVGVGQVQCVDDAKRVSQEIADRLHDHGIEFLHWQAPAAICRRGPLYQAL